MYSNSSTKSQSDCFFHKYHTNFELLIIYCTKNRLSVGRVFKARSFMSKNTRFAYHSVKDKRICVGIYPKLKKLNDNSLRVTQHM